MWSEKIDAAFLKCQGSFSEVPSPDVPAGKWGPKWGQDIIIYKNLRFSRDL